MSARISLAAGATQRIRLQRGDLLVCQRGSLWLSCAGEDIVLSSGQRHLATTTQILVVEALASAGYSLQPRRLPFSGLLQRLKQLAGAAIHNNPKEKIQ